MRWSDTNFETLNKDLPDDEKPNFEIHKKWGTPDVEDRAYVPLEAYNQSKVANLLFSIGVNKRLQQKHGVMALTAHPGWIQTDLERSAPEALRQSIKEVGKAQGVVYKTLGAGAATSLVAALDPKLAAEQETKDGKENYGVFLADCQLTNGAHPKACSSSEAEKLWKLSENLVKEKFYW
jgi:NAD(P)-dependent dehydrogenase (short-subunit alcohol dehydrogenase family)